MNTNRTKVPGATDAIRIRLLCVDRGLPGLLAPVTSISPDARPSRAPPSQNPRLAG